MSRVYSVEFENVSVTAGQDLFYIAPADDKPCRLLACYLAQISDVGDAQEEVLRLRIIRGHGTVGSGGSSATARPLAASDPAASFTARTNDTTIASAGTAVNIHSDAFNIRAGWQYIPTPETVILCTQADATIVVRLLAAPADAVTVSGTLYVEEL